MKHALACLLTLVCLPAAAQQRPNVLFIAVDDLRPDIGCYGVKHAKTPNIDRLAARGVVFDRAYCAQAVCSPSRTAILTGLRPDTTKVWDLETHFRDAQPNCVTLPQHFRANGYHTSALGKIEHHGFEDGPSWTEARWFPSGEMVKVDEQDWTKHTVTKFEGVPSEFSKPMEGGEKRKGGKAAKKGPAYEVSPKSDEELPDGAVAAEAVKRLSALKAAGKPFFFGVGFVKPHLPFVAPRKYWDMHDPEKIPGPAFVTYPEGTPDFVGHTNGELHAYPGTPKENPIPEDFAKTLRHGYNACISYTDAQIGRVLDALDKEGLADSTVIVLWGDHGWQLGEHGLWHKHTNFEVAARAPLLIALPKSASAGRHCAAPVEFVDVYPTLADVCGLKVPQGLAGMSLKPYLENPEAPMQKPAISVYPKSSKEHGGALMGYSVRDERWRGTFWRKRNTADIGFIELYDHQNDPNETVNLATKPEHAKVIASLQKHLPPAGSDFQPKKSGRVVKVTGGAGKGKGYDPNEPRDKRYDRLYPGKPKLTESEYLAGQGGDKAEAKARFVKLDADKDGFVTRDEFISSGRKKGS
jgi:arylsulfatase A-like enzyme